MTSLMSDVMTIDQLTAEIGTVAQEHRIHGKPVGMEFRQVNTEQPFSLRVN